jgi:hypothetical protein
MAPTPAAAPVPGTAGVRMSLAAARIAFGTAAQTIAANIR